MDFLRDWPPAPPPKNELADRMAEKGLVKMMNAIKNTQLIGAVTLPLRLVVSWLFLSAVHRRLILDPSKHDMESAGWIGHKINTFFPQANGIFRDVLEYASANPEVMHWFAWGFTLSELFLGILLLFGFLSRFTGVLLVSLAIGLMHSAGWLGPTCLDEWQIASLLVMSGGILAIFGSGDYSLDSYLNRRCERLRGNKYWSYLTQLDALKYFKGFDKCVVLYSLALLGYVMATNQLLHGGVWGVLRNDSVRPNIEISDFITEVKEVRFTAFRDKGPETYGAFIIDINFYDRDGTILYQADQSSTSKSQAEIVSNYYINKVVANNSSLVFPLGSKADLRLTLPADVIRKMAGGSIELVDISERKFTLEID